MVKDPRHHGWGWGGGGSVHQAGSVAARSQPRRLKDLLDNETTQALRGTMTLSKFDSQSQKVLRILSEEGVTPPMERWIYKYIFKYT